MSKGARWREVMFLKSAFATEGLCGDVTELLAWVKDQADAVGVNIEKTSFDGLNLWSYDRAQGRLRHDSGQFFSIDGVHVETNWGETSSWEQPIINQPEIGFLGFITKEFDGVLHFLAQAKIEPGNLNKVQISPTLQATRSNYTQAHKGKKPNYLEYFQNATSDQILVDQLQSEQGARFWKKRNRNIIIKVDEDIPVLDNFVWLTLWQIKRLMHYENIVNMDTRTVISGIPYGTFEEDTIELLSYIGHPAKGASSCDMLLKSALMSDHACHTEEEIITFLTRLKSVYDLDVRRVPLHEVENWVFGEDKIHHVDNKYFNVIAVNVEITNREVAQWSQPMIEPAQGGLLAFVCKEINGVLHFIVQAKLECGNQDIIEFAPTVQCLTENYEVAKDGSLPFLDYVLNARKEQRILDVMQSEEGGRFYHEKNRNIIVLGGDEVPDELPPNYIWMTLNQLYRFLKFNNFLNMQARSLLSAISFL